MSFLLFPIREDINISCTSCTSVFNLYKLLSLRAAVSVSLRSLAVRLIDFYMCFFCVFLSEQINDDDDDDDDDIRCHSVCVHVVGL